MEKVYLFVSEYEDGVVINGVYATRKAAEEHRAAYLREWPAMSHYFAVEEWPVLGAFGGSP